MLSIFHVSRVDNALSAPLLKVNGYLIAYSKHKAWHYFLYFLLMLFCIYVTSRYNGDGNKQVVKRSRMLGKYCCLVSWIGMLFHSAFAVAIVDLSKPELKTPVFSQLTTENGLSQDTINVLHVDNQGFLWLGTDTGLNRYDGYRVEAIEPEGTALGAKTINDLWQDSHGNLWIATFSAGVFKLDLTTGKATRVDARKSQVIPDWQQGANAFAEDETGNIWIAFDEDVLTYDGPTNALNTVFSMSQARIEKGYFIRTLMWSGDLLYIGTSEGLLVYSRSQQKTVDLGFLFAGFANDDQKNVKTLYVDASRDRLMIGTVKGLYTLSLAQIEQFVTQGTQPEPLSTLIESRNIWRIRSTDNSLFYLPTDQGIYTYDAQSQQISHLLRPTDSRLLLSKDVIYDVGFDGKQNLWLGTRSDGALHWMRTSQVFHNVFNRAGGRVDKTLSDNNVWSLWQSDASGYWVGTDNGLNFYNTETATTRQFMVSDEDMPQYSASSIHQILAADTGYLWLLTGDGLRRFNINTEMLEVIKVDSEPVPNILGEYIFAGNVNRNGDLFFIYEQGVYHYSTVTHKVTALTELNAQPITKLLYSILPSLPSAPNNLVLSALGGLYQWDPVKLKLMPIHQLDHTLHANIAADSWVLDAQNILWISYPGYGLVGLDGDTFEQRYLFDKSNLLPSNNIYSLQQDANGSIWISSHNGLLKFNPRSHTLQRYGHSHGLINEEFNQGANLQLINGQLIFGSPKGLVVFDPAQLPSNPSSTMTPKITDISVSSVQYSSALSDLSGSTVHLQHDDLGLRISFSTLEFDSIHSTRYQYRLTGARDIVYPLTDESHVYFPKLEPGSYEFSVTAIGMSGGEISPSASIFIKVDYSPWKSPLAFLSYALLIMLVLYVVWKRRRFQAQRLRSAHREALQSKARLSLALRASNSGVWEWDEWTDQVLASRITGELGYRDKLEYVPREEHIALIHNRDREHYLSQWGAFIRSKDKVLDVTYRMITQQGHCLWYRDVGNVTGGSANEGNQKVVGTYTNVTESITEQEDLRLFGEAYKHTRDWVLVCNRHTEPLAANQAFCDTFGIDDQNDIARQLRHVYRGNETELLQFWSTLKELKAGDDWRGEDQIILHNHEVRDVLVYIKAVASINDVTDIDSYLIILSDISEHKKAQQALMKLANFDSLTGLPNRTLLLDRVNHAIDQAQRGTHTLGLFFIDLDKFKQVNDSLGHSAGDTLLQEISARLLNLLRKEDTIARLGGDEFVVLIEHVQSIEGLTHLASQIINIIDTPVQLDNHMVSVSSSIGIALYPEDALNAEELLQNADIAMYHAKENGRSNFQFFTAKMNVLAQQRLALESDLKSAHSQQKFENHYQPIVDISRNEIVGFELLMRWFTDTGKVSPGRFIPVAEELGLIESMTLQAMERALPMFKYWQEVNFKGYLSINLSARHFESLQSINDIIAFLATNQLPVNAVRFEITESALMKDYQKAIVYMQRLKEVGFCIALDDFGTGYSSLKYLKEFPLSVIKVDKSFVDDIGVNSNNEALIETILRMAQSLDMYCVAEGIETLEQVEFFKQHECHFLQGYYFSRPVAMGDTFALIDKKWLTNES